MIRRFFILFGIPVFVVSFTFLFFMTFASLRFNYDYENNSLDNISTQGLKLDQEVNSELSKKLIDNLDFFSRIFNIPIWDIKFNVYAQNELYILNGSEYRSTFFNVAFAEKYEHAIKTGEYRIVYRGSTLKDFIQNAPAFSLDIGDPISSKDVLPNKNFLLISTRPTLWTLLVIFISTLVIWYAVLNFFYGCKRFILLGDFR